VYLIILTAEKITHIVTQSREHSLGRIHHAMMHLSPLVHIVQQEWLPSAALRQKLCLYEDEYVIMPNHLHGIVWIIPGDPVQEHCIPKVSAGQACAERSLSMPTRLPRSLSSFVAGFKASVTRRARKELDISAVWHRKTYEHIIRSEQDFQRIWKYIDSNPQRWQQDHFHPPPSEAD
jgi:putative transposase